MVTAHEQQILNELWEYLTPRRRARFEAVLARRTRSLTVALEGVEQPHNQSAVLRTAEAMGLQDVHNVESARRFQIARDVARGCDQWLTVHRHRGGRDGIRCCLAELKADGFWILAATPHPPATTLAEITVKQKTAVVIGHEKEGVSPAVLEFADERVVIPMSGFVESFNLSVAAALCLFELRAKLDASDVD